MGEYWDELKDVRKELKKILTKNKIKASVIAGKGTSWEYTDIFKPKGQTEWTKRQLKVLQDDLGIQIGHPSNMGLVHGDKLIPKVKGYKHRKYKKSPKYLKLKQDFTDCAMKQQDGGTCVLGAGTVVQKKGVPIDFWRQHGQGETRDWIAQRIMKDRALAMGITFKHEGGRMD